MVVADASAVVELLLERPAATRVERRLYAGGETVHAPHLLDLEVAQVLRRHQLRGVLTPERCAQSIVDLSEMPLTRYPHDILLMRVWALRANVTAYDAAYVALAEALAVPLVTLDRRLAAVRGHRARIELL